MESKFTLNHLCDAGSLSEQFLAFLRITVPSSSELSSFRTGELILIGLLITEDEDTIFLLNFWNYSPSNTITAQKTCILSNTIARTSHSVTIQLLSCLTLRSCSGWHMAAGAHCFFCWSVAARSPSSSLLTQMQSVCIRFFSLHYLMGL